MSTTNTQIGQGSTGVDARSGRHNDSARPANGDDAFTVATTGVADGSAPAARTSSSDLNTGGQHPSGARPATRGPMQIGLIGALAAVLVVLVLALTGVVPTSGHGPAAMAPTTPHVPAAGTAGLGAEEKALRFVQQVQAGDYLASEQYLTRSDQVLLATADRVTQINVITAIASDDGILGAGDCTSAYRVNAAEVDVRCDVLPLRIPVDAGSQPGVEIYPLPYLNQHDQTGGLPVPAQPLPGTGTVGTHGGSTDVAPPVAAAA